MKGKVGCAGILVMDTFCGPMDRLPVEGELLALDSFTVRAGGCAPNVAISLAKQGASVELSGCVGRDVQGDGVISALENAGVGCQPVVRSNVLPTSQTAILLVKNQDRRFIHVFGANKEYSISHIDLKWVEGLKVFYLGGLYAMPGIHMDELGTLLHFCRQRNITTVVDVVVPQYQKGHGGLDRILPLIDYFLPNDQEAERLTGKKEPMAQIREFKAAGANTIIVTCGAKGAITAYGNQVLHSEIFPTAAVDPSGSGDAFTAGIIVGILNNWSIGQTLTYASALGASATRAIGCTDSVFTAEEAATFLKANTLAITCEPL